MAVPRFVGGNIKSIFAATTGGVMEWDPVLSKGSMHTGLQGLPSLDIASVVADSSGNIWAVCTDGHLAVLEAGASSWASVGSYPASGWTFSPGAATFWKGYLVLGGPKGLSLFSTDPKQLDAVDNISSFGNIRDTVSTVMAQGDTIWVSTPEGLAFATDPVWNTDSASKHIGTAGYYLSADRWTTRPAATRGSYTLLQDSTGIHLGVPGQWSDFADGLRVDAGTLRWTGGSAAIPGATQALSTPWGYFVSTVGNGLQELTSDGSLHFLHPDGALPDRLPYSVAMGSDGTLMHLTGDGISIRLWRRGAGGVWVPETLQVRSPDSPASTIHPVWDLNSDLSYQRRVMTVGPKGEIVVGSWGDPVTHGGFLVSSSPGTWTLWNRTNDTCFQEPLGSGFGTIALDVHPSSSGVWASTLSGGTGPIIFFPSAGDKTPICMDIDASQIQILSQIQVNDLLPIGTSLWLASSKGLIKVPNAAPSYPPQNPSGLMNWQSNAMFNRLVEYPLSGRSWIVAAGNGLLEAISADAGPTDSAYKAPGATQAYTSLVVDAQGQIWAAGGNGIDIFSLQLSDSATPTFTLLHKVTQSDGLPDNDIRDLVLDSASGRAIIASAYGLSLWTSPYRSLPPRLAKSTVKVYPNPVRLRQNKTLFVDGATFGAQFDLIAADGTLVLHQDRDKSTNGRFQIELPSTSKLRPGVYYWSLKDSRNSVRGPLIIGE